MKNSAELINSTNQRFTSKEYLKDIVRVEQIWPQLKEKFGNVIAVNQIHGNLQDKLSYSELALNISYAANAFISLGLKRNDVTCLFAENSPRWLIADQGIMTAGGIDAVRGCDASSEELNYIIEDSKAIGLIVQSDKILEKITFKDDFKNKYNFIIQFEGEAREGVLSWNDFLEIGKTALETINKDDDQSKNNSDDIATILYTSGTTGRPKGVPLTHANLLHQIKSLSFIANPSPGDSVLSVLPIWHSYERSAEYFFFANGCTQFYTNVRDLKEDLKIVQPEVMATVPRIWEAIHDGFFDVLNKMNPLRKTFLKLGLTISSKYKLSIREFNCKTIEKINFLGRSIALLTIIYLFFIHKLFARFIWPKLLNQLCGTRLKYPINGGGALALHVDLFFEAIGVELLVGYGLTETSPVISCRRRSNNIRGTSGEPLPETEIKIVDQENLKIKKFYEMGKVFVKGPQVMKGYLNKPEATKKVLFQDGWFDTGDLGMIIPSGSLVLTGRSKDTVVLSNGENVEPVPLEDCIKSCSFITQVMLVGQDEKNLGALLVVDKESLASWLNEDDFNDSSFKNDLKIKQLIKNEINLLLSNRKGSRSYERISGLAIVEPFTIANGLLTQTLKQKRDKIRERDYLSIQEIYGKQVKS
tara:strand:+ start:11048 stop:12979 length:1932 start_codon:yes stop_codon:yes gene_type:complete